METLNGEIIKMAKAPKANAVVGQSGGPTGVINASLVGIIEEAKKRGISTETPPKPVTTPKKEGEKK